MRKAESIVADVDLVTESGESGGVPAITIGYAFDDMERLGLRQQEITGNNKTK